MNIEEVREYVLAFPEVEEVEQFTDIIVYKIAGKWFAVCGLERPDYVAVKCDPDRAAMLRDRYDAVTPAWHFNKKHWNDLRITSLPSAVVKREIRHSYLTVIRRNVAPKALRQELEAVAERAGIDDSLPE